MLSYQSKANNIIKQTITNAVQNACFKFGLSAAMAKRTAVARVLMFHGVGDAAHPAQLLEDKIIFLKKHFTIISLDQLISMIANKADFSDEVVLTFDDGLKNNAVHAYPILKKHQVPATFYVCPGLIESGQWLWNQEARERLRSLSPDNMALFAQRWECNAELESIVSVLKTLPITERQQAEISLREHTPNFMPNAEQKNAFDMMTWGDLKSLDPDIVTVGSHTTNHVIAKNLSTDELQLELVQSKQILEETLGRPIEHFCYPNGDFDQATVTKVKRTYKSAVTTDEGFVGTDDDRYLFNRIPSECSLGYFAWRLIRPRS